MLIEETTPLSYLVILFPPIRTWSWHQRAFGVLLLFLTEEEKTHLFWRRERAVGVFWRLLLDESGSSEVLVSAVEASHSWTWAPNACADLTLVWPFGEQAAFVILGENCNNQGGRGKRRSFPSSQGAELAQWAVSCMQKGWHHIARSGSTWTVDF